MRIPDMDEVQRDLQREERAAQNRVSQPASEVHHQSQAGAALRPMSIDSPAAAGAPAPAEHEMPRERKLVFMLTYIVYVLVNTVNGPLMPAIKSSIGFSSGDAASIVAVQTTAIGLGKLFWGGWPVDLCGARRTYAVSMLVLSCLVLGYSLAYSVMAVALCAFAVEFLST